MPCGSTNGIRLLVRSFVVELWWPEVFGWGWFSGADRAWLLAADRTNPSRHFHATGRTVDAHLRRKPEADGRAR